MADKITWADKESLVTDPTIAEKNKVTDGNMNEIKSVTNTNADELTEKIVYDESDITENTGVLIEEVPEGSNIPYINSEVAIGSSNEDNRPVWFKQGKNLLNKNDTIGQAGNYLDNTGEVQSGTDNLRISNYIGIDALKGNITCSGMINAMSTPAICFYDINKTFISGESYGGVDTKTIAIPTNAFYFRTSFRTTNTETQIEYGTTATTYEDYIAPSIIADNTEFYTKPEFKTGAVTWNTTNVTGDSSKNTWYKIGNIVIAILEFTPLSGKIANNNIICSGLPSAKAIFTYGEESRQFIVNQVGNCMWYYPTNTTNLNRIDTTIVYVTD